MGLNRPEAPSISALAALLAMDRTTLTANLKPLERRKFVALEVDSNDRRGRRVRLTDLGLDALAAALPVWERTHAELDVHLTRIGAPDMARHLWAITEQHHPKHT